MFKFNYDMLEILVVLLSITLNCFSSLASKKICFKMALLQQLIISFCVNPLM